jgi:hypothetical protein
MREPTPPAPPEILARLRAALPDKERALVGYEGVQGYLRELGITTREGFVPSVRTLKRWRQRRRLPVFTTPLGRPWSSSFLILSWLASADFAALSPRRPDGTLTRRVSLRQSGR